MKTILYLLLLLVGFTAVSAQERAIQKAEFEAVMKNAIAILDARPHRVTVAREMKVNGMPQESSSEKVIVEIAAKDKRRAVREIKSAKQNLKREIIRVGDKEYSRENNGQWQQTGIKNRAESENLKVNSEENVYKSLGKDTLNNENVSVYQRISNRAMTDNSNNEELNLTENVKYWIDDKGTLLKREMTRESRRPGKTFNTTMTVTFDYDQNIQVIAPQIAGN